MTSQPMVIEASPTKTLFVKILTRNIELRDAILDLLNDGIDGIYRVKHKGLDIYAISYK